MEEERPFGMKFVSKPVLDHLATLNTKEERLYYLTQRAIPFKRWINEFESFGQTDYKKLCEQTESAYQKHLAKPIFFNDHNAHGSLYERVTIEGQIKLYKGAIVELDILYGLERDKPEETEKRVSPIIKLEGTKRKFSGPKKAFIIFYEGFEEPKKHINQSLWDDFRVWKKRTNRVKSDPSTNSKRIKLFDEMISELSPEARIKAEMEYNELLQNIDKEEAR